MVSNLPRAAQHSGWPVSTRCAAVPLSCLQILILPVPGPPALSLVTPPPMAFPGASATPGIWTLRAQGLRGLPGPSGGPSSGPSCVPASLQYMEKLSQLAYHPLKMHSCYEKMEPLRLDGLQQRFDVSSMSVFKQRAQIHMREVGTGLAFTPVLPIIPHVLSGSSLLDMLLDLFGCLSLCPPG